MGGTSVIILPPSPPQSEPLTHQTHHDTSIHFGRAHTAAQREHLPTNFVIGGIAAIHLEKSGSAQHGLGPLDFSLRHVLRGGGESQRERGGRIPRVRGNINGFAANRSAKARRVPNIKQILSPYLANAQPLLRQLIAEIFELVVGCSGKDTP